MSDTTAKPVTGDRKWIVELGRLAKEMYAHSTHQDDKGKWEAVAGYIAATTEDIIAKSLDAAPDGLAERVKALEQTTEHIGVSLDTQIGKITKEIDVHDAALNEHADILRSHIERLDAHDAALERLDRHAKGHDQRIGRHDAALEDVQYHLNQLDEYTATRAALAEVRRRFEHHAEGNRYEIGEVMGILQDVITSGGSSTPPDPAPEVPAWAEHVEVSIGAHRQEWMEGGQPHHNWARSCWGNGPTLESAIADMVSKPCATQEDWDATLQLNPHIAAAVSEEGTR